MNKKLFFLKAVKVLVVVIITTFILTGCNKNSKSPWEDPLSFYSESISQYHNASIGNKSKLVVGNQTVYVDFSDGLVQAYGSETNKKVIDYISQKMVGSGIDWYGLGKEHNGIGKLNFTNDREIYNKVISTGSYTDIMAPIQQTLEKIISSSNDALLITDFEEYTQNGKEQPFAYAKESFTKWVEAGNSITFYYSQYNETNKNSKITGAKNLYFVVFNYGTKNESSLLTKFEKAIEGRGNELPGLNKFEINPNPYIISNEYGGKEKTGLTLDPDIENKSALDIGDKEGAVLYYENGFLNNNNPYEAFEFGLSINDLYDFYFKGKGRFSKKLFLNATNSSSYLLENVKVQVTDVTLDYINYIKSTEALKNIPALEDNEGKNKVWSKADIDNPIISECYEKNTQKIKKEYLYKYTQGEFITEMFDFDAEIFASHLKNTPKEVELISTFHKNFSGKFNSKDQIILRLDYIIESTNENYSTQLEAFKWNSVITKGAQNNSLYESIRNTLQDVKPKGILYSYYLKLEQKK